jgi:hypothetical protein
LTRSIKTRAVDRHRLPNDALQVPLIFINAMLKSTAPWIPKINQKKCNKADMRYVMRSRYTHAHDLAEKPRGGAVREE